MTQIPAEQQLATLIANVYSGQAIHDIRDAARIPSASQVVRFYFENELSSVLSSPAEFAQTLLHQLTVEDRMEASECIALAARIGKLVVDALLQPCEHRILLDFGAAALGLLMKQIKVVPSEVVCCCALWAFLERYLSAYCILGTTFGLVPQFASAYPGLHPSLMV